MFCKNDILSCLLHLKKEFGILDLQIGLAGSFAGGYETAESDIDVVLHSFGEDYSADDSIAQKIRQIVGDTFHREVDILWLSLLEEEDRKLDLLANEIGIEGNQDSTYKTIQREVIWV